MKIALMRRRMSAKSMCSCSAVAVTAMGHPQVGMTDNAPELCRVPPGLARARQPPPTAEALYKRERDGVLNGRTEPSSGHDAAARARAAARGDTDRAVRHAPHFQYLANAASRHVARR